MRLKRRDFIGGAAAALLGGCAGAPSVATCARPSGKVNVAFVGVGNRGWSNVFTFAYHKDLVNVVALCDTQIGALHTLKALQQFPEVPRFTDFRKMFDKMAGDIDAVVVSTPDFSHFPVAMLAMSLGKAVYCEKPLCNTFREAGLMAAAAKRYGVVTQMGNQGHTTSNFWQFSELVRSGFIKDVVRINAFMCDSRRWHKWNGTMREMPGGEDVLPGLDWNSWQAQRPERSFSSAYLNGEWRCFFEYGTGALGDWGAHLFDAAWECLELGHPEKIEVIAEEGETKCVYPMKSRVEFSFPARGAMPPLVLEWRDGVGNEPPKPEKLTEKRWSRLAHGAEIYLADGRVFSRASHDSVLLPVAGASAKDPAVKKAMHGFARGKYDHYESFIRAVRGEEKTTSPFEVSGPFSQLLAMGALAQRMGAGTKLAFDRKAKRFVGNDAANAFLDGPPARPGWAEYAKLA